LTFPPSVELRGEPAIGNQAIFDFRAQTDPFRILVWPKIPGNARDVSAGSAFWRALEPTDLPRLRDHAPHRAQDRSAGRSVQEVRFEFPERARESEFVRDKMHAFSKKLEETYQERTKWLDRRIEEATRSRMAKAMLERMECTTLSKRAMVDLVVVRAEKLCQLGRFGLSNSPSRTARGSAFTWKPCVSTRRRGGAEGEIEAVPIYSGETSLSFDQDVRGSACLRRRPTAASPTR